MSRGIAEEPADAKVSGGSDGEPVGMSGRWFVLAIVLSAVFVQILDTTITMVAIPSIQSDLDASFGEIQLVVAGYSLAFACLLITAGRLGDTYGRKRMFLLGMAGFTAMSVLCGAAPNSLTLVIARILQGLFSGLMLPQVLSIIQVSFSDKERPKAFSIYGATFGLATVTGPVVGGALIKLNLWGTDWRSIFYVNLPIGLLALLAGFPKIRESRAPKADKLDLTGATIITAGVFMLILPLVVGRDQGWPAWTYVLLVASVPVLALFFWYEARLTKRPGSSPLVRTTLFRQRSFSIGIMLSLIFFAAIPAFFFIFYLTFQIGLGYSPVLAGSVSLAFAMPLAAASARSAAVVRKIGTWVLLVGTILVLVGMGGVIVTVRWAGAGLTGWDMVPAMMVAGAGTGLFLAPVINVLLAGIRHEDAGAASGVLSTMQQIGASLGIAMIGIIFFGLLRTGGPSSADVAVPHLRTQLTAAGLPAQASDQVVANFKTCFKDRSSSKDPSATPASCAKIEQEMSQSPAPAEVKAKVRKAVLDEAVPHARRKDFTHALQNALFWQIGIMTVCALLILALPKVKPTTSTPAAA